jgi:hypothetical protein
MASLRNRNMAIPSGIVYRQPETRVGPPAWSSFEAQVNWVQSYRRANLFLARQHNWALDRESISAEIDSYLAKVCMDQGWTKYVFIEGEPEQTAQKKSLKERLENVVAGAETLVEWLKNGADAVPKPKAEARSEVCVGCEKNGQGGLEAYFTRPAAEAIRREVSRKAEWKLETSNDERLGVCEACSCPLNSRFICR